MSISISIWTSFNINMNIKVRCITGGCFFWEPQRPVERIYQESSACLRMCKHASSGDCVRTHCVFVRLHPYTCICICDALFRIEFRAEYHPESKVQQWTKSAIYSPRVDGSQNETFRNWRVPKRCSRGRRLRKHMLEVDWVEIEFARTWLLLCCSKVDWFLERSLQVAVFRVDWFILELFEVDLPWRQISQK